MAGKDKDNKPNTAQMNEMRQWLRDRGLTAAQANAIVTPGKSRGQIDVDSTEFFRGLRKG